MREAVKRTVWARKRSTYCYIVVTHPWRLPLVGRPPDFLDIETSDPAQLSVEPLAENRTQQELQRLALKARQEARASS